MFWKTTWKAPYSRWRRPIGIGLALVVLDAAMTLTAWKILRRNDEQKGSCAYKRLAYAVSAAALLVALGASTVEASTEFEEVIDLRFSADCQSASGFYWQWVVTVEPDRDAALAHAEQYDQLVPVSWGPDEPIHLRTGAAAGFVDQEYRFVLMAADRKTVLLEAPYAVEGGGTVDYQFVLDATVDCSAVPYTQVASPNTAVRRSIPSALPVIGMLLLATGIGIGVWGRRRAH